MKNKRIKRSIFELTSLLDIIMILLFAFAIRNQELTEAAGLEKDTAISAKNLELDEMKDILSAQNELLINMNESDVEKDAQIESLLAEKKKLEEQIKELQRQLTNAESKLEEGNEAESVEKIKKLESALEAYNYMNEVVKVINISLELEPGLTSRKLIFGKAGGEQIRMTDRTKKAK